MSIVLDGSNQTTGGLINSGTAQASTSGTAITFTGIPSTAKRITVMFNSVKTNGSSIVLMQVGSGSVVTTGYIGACIQAQGGSNPSSFAFPNYSGFVIDGGTNSAALRNGTLVLALLGSNIWTISGNIGRNDIGAVSMVGGTTPTLSGALDRVVITTVNGTDTFNAGSINIFWE